MRNLNSMIKTGISSYIAFDGDREDLIALIKSKKQKLIQERYSSKSLKDQLALNQKFFFEASAMIYDFVLRDFPEYKDYLSMHAFGSAARREAPLTSDIDLFFVVNNSQLTDKPDFEYLIEDILELVGKADLEKTIHASIYFINDVEIEPQTIYIQTGQEISSPRDNTNASWNVFQGSQKMGVGISTFMSPTPWINAILLRGKDPGKGMPQLASSKLTKFFYAMLVRDYSDFSSYLYEEGNRQKKIKHVFQRPLNYIAWIKQLGLADPGINIDDLLKKILFIRQNLCSDTKPTDMLTQASYDQFFKKANKDLKQEYYRLFGNQQNFTKFKDVILVQFSKDIYSKIMELKPKLTDQSIDNRVLFFARSWKNFFERQAPMIKQKFPKQYAQLVNNKTTVSISEYVIAKYVEYSLQKNYSKVWDMDLLNAQMIDFWSQNSDEKKEEWLNQMVSLIR